MELPSESAKQRYLVSLDTLLDTRLGTVALLDVELSKKLIAGEEYFTRKTDYFKNKSKKFKAADYDQFWERRTTDVLKVSVRTKLWDYLLDDVMEQIKQPETRFLDINREFYLNIHPYNLSAAEQEVWLDAVKQLLPVFQQYKIVSYSPAALTPEMIKTQDFTFVFQYEWQRWLNSNLTRLEYCRIPKHYMIFPSLQDREIPASADQTLKDLSAVISPNKAMEIFMMEHMLMSLRFEDVKVFCIDRDLIKVQNTRHKGGA